MRRPVSECMRRVLPLCNLINIITHLTSSIHLIWRLVYCWGRNSYFWGLVKSRILVLTSRAYKHICIYCAGLRGIRDRAGSCFDNLSQAVFGKGCVLMNLGQWNFSRDEVCWYGSVERSQDHKSRIWFPLHRESDIQERILHRLAKYFCYLVYWNQIWCWYKIGKRRFWNSQTQRTMIACIKSHNKKACNAAGYLCNWLGLALISKYFHFHWISMAFCLYGLHSFDASISWCLNGSFFTPIKRMKCRSPI